MGLPKIDGLAPPIGKLTMTNFLWILAIYQQTKPRILFFQFYTRTNQNKDIISRLKKHLSTYFEADELLNKGIPTITECGKALNISGNYLSDLLRLETGNSAKIHIQNYIIEKAKTSLAGSNILIKELAYSLGFKYPQHFSKLLKIKTGKSPSEYRNMN